MVILLDPTGGESGGSGATRTETIVLAVSCPPQDFATVGGIKDGIDALNRLNVAYERTRNNLQRGFQIGGSSGNVSTSGEIKLMVSGSAIQASLMPGQKIKLNLSASDFQPTGLGRHHGASAGSPPAQSLGAQAPRKTSAEEINQTFGLRQAGALNEFGVTLSGLSGPPGQVSQAKQAAVVAYHQRIQSAAGSAASAAGEAGLDNLQVTYMKKQAHAYKDGEAAAMGLRLETNRLNDSTRLIGKNMIGAVKQMALWGSAAGVLYGSLSMLRRALDENVQITSEMAILSVTFKGGADAVSGLTDKVIHLAAVNGRFAGEAVESATELARVYSTQKDIIDATNASLVLANISGRNSAETTQFLSAMTETYQLRAQELNAVVGEMAAISQTANISVEGLMRGMESVAEAARTAGLSYSQTMGLITGGVMATQQSGTSVANTVKTFVTQMGNPEIGNKLRFGYGIEITGAGGELKQMPQILREIYTAWERMSEAERRSLLFNVGGRQNAARLAGVLDDFVQGQLKAAQGQLHLNSAEVENEAIMGTLRAQWQGLASEFERFVNQQGGGVVRVLRDITHSIRDVLSALNTPVGGTLTSVVGAIGVAGMARMMISGYSLEKQGTLAAGTKGGLLVSTARAVQGDVAAIGNAFNATAAVGANRLNWALEKIGVGSVVASGGIGQATLASRGLLATFVALTDVILPLAAALGLLYTFRKISDYRTGADQLLLRQRDAQLSQGRMQGVSAMRSMLQTDINIVGQPGVPRDRLRGVARDMAQSELPFGTPAEVENLAKQNELLVVQGRDTELIAQAKLKMAQLDRDYTGNLEASKVEYQEIIRLAEKQIAIEQIRQGFQKNNGFGGTIDRVFHDPEVEISTAKATIQEARQALAALKAAAQEEADLANGSWVTREAQTRFVGAMRQEAFGGIGRQFNLLPTASAVDVQNRHVAELTRQQIYLNEEHAQIAAMPGGVAGSPDQEQKMRLLREAEEKRAQSMADLRAAQSPEISSATRNEARLNIYSRMGRAEWEGFARAPMRGELTEHRNLTEGLSDAEKMVNQSILGRGRLQELRYETQTRQGTDGEMRQRNAEVLQLEIGLMESKVSAQLKIIELTREEINLNAQARREYERSLLTSSPSELLRKAATMRLAHNRGVGEPGGIGAGEFFALSQESREDLMRMPGNTDAERQARRSRGALERYFGRASAFDLGEQAVGGAISASRYGSLVSVPSPQFSIPEGAIAAIMSLGTESAAAAMHIATLTQHVSQLGDALAHILSHSGQTNSGPPPIAQSIPAHIRPYR